MIVSSSQGAYGTAPLSGVPAVRRRLSEALFGFFQSAVGANHRAGDGHTDAAPQRSFMELPDHPAAQGLVDALILRQQFSLPSELTMMPGRVSRTSCLQAAGFTDVQAKSVGVDIAVWSEPCAPRLDEIGWRRVFTWVVGSDRRLTNVSIVDPPAWRGASLAGSYGYNADGIPGYGVLQITPAADGSWRICDCWGDSLDADRVDELAARTRAA